MLCVSVAEPGFERISHLIKNSEMAEIRIEKSGLTVDQVKKLFQNHKHLIATCRPEGLSTPERMDFIKAAIDGGAAWVDIEIESEERYLEELRNYAKAKGCRVIVSYHNYSETPDNELLNQLLIDAVNAKADLVKIATKVQTMQDTARLLALYQFKLPLLAIGMGNLGKISRIAALELGAPFTFVSSNQSEETAPGQLPEESMNEILKHLIS